MNTNQSDTQLQNMPEITGIGLGFKDLQTGYLWATEVTAREEVARLHVCVCVSVSLCVCDGMSVCMCVHLCGVSMGVCMCIHVCECFFVYMCGLCVCVCVCLCVLMWYGVVRFMMIKTLSERYCHRRSSQTNNIFGTFRPVGRFQPSSRAVYTKFKKAKVYCDVIDNLASGLSRS